MTTSPAFVTGPIMIDDADLYARAVSIARAHAYSLTEDDSSHGRFSVEAHTTLRAGRGASFVVQCYQHGWLRVTASSSAIRQQGSEMRMPTPLYEELRALALALTDELGAAPGAREPGEHR